MPRRTKEESALTRRRIVAAARRTFLKRGITGTTLEHVAKAAHVTRGAIYWHFANKKALFDAMRAEVSVPMLDRTDAEKLDAGRTGSADPLACVERFLLGMIEGVDSRLEIRQTFEIMAFKCEYVGDFESELSGHRAKAAEIADRLTASYTAARRAKVLRAGTTPRLAALETLSFLMGLMRLWLLDQQALIVRQSARELIAAHVAGQRA